MSINESLDFMTEFGVLELNMKEKVRTFYHHRETGDNKNTPALFSYKRRNIVPDNLKTT